MNEKDIINKISDDISKKKEILKKDIAKIVKKMYLLIEMICIILSVMEVDII